MADLLMRECGGDLWGPDGKLLMAGMKPVAGLLPPAAAAVPAVPAAAAGAEQYNAPDDDKDIIAILVGAREGGREGGQRRAGARFVGVGVVFS